MKQNVHAEVIKTVFEWWNSQLFIIVHFPSAIGIQNNVEIGVSQLNLWFFPLTLKLIIFLIFPIFFLAAADFWPFIQIFRIIQFWIIVCVCSVCCCAYISLALPSCHIIHFNDFVFSFRAYGTKSNSLNSVVVGHGHEWRK